MIPAPEAALIALGLAHGDRQIFNETSEGQRSIGVAKESEYCNS